MRYENGWIGHKLDEEVSMTEHSHDLEKKKVDNSPNRPIPETAAERSITVMAVVIAN